MRVRISVTPSKDAVARWRIQFLDELEAFLGERHYLEDFKLELLGFEVTVRSFREEAEEP